MKIAIKRSFGFIVALLFSLLCVAAHAQSGSGAYALLIANSSSETRVDWSSRLAQLADHLQQQGFTVTVRQDLTQSSLQQALLDFGAHAGETGLFFFAGDTQVTAQNNYLLPVDYSPSSQASVRLSAVELQAVIEQLTRFGQGIAIFETDGLNIVQAPDHVLLAFATTPGQSRVPPIGQEWLYTRVLLSNLQLANFDYQQLFNEVRQQVVYLSDGRQLPWEIAGPQVQWSFSAADPSGQVERPLTGVDEPVEPSTLPQASQTAPVTQLVSDPTADLAEPQADKEEVQADAVAPVASASNAFQPGEVFQDCDTCPEMVVVPAGTFLMGSEHGDPDEQPVHAVTLPAFAIGKYEVTQREWQAVMGENPSGFVECGADCPVEQVSWYQAQQFVALLSQQTGEKYRLPSEAQWEYAARAGTDTPFYTGDCLGYHQANFDATLSYADCSVQPAGQAQQTVEAGQYLSNAFGLYDMAGNVWEWVTDVYHENYQQAPADGSAWIQGGEQAQRVLRGGSWNDGPGSARSMNRNRYQANGSGNGIGFRVIRVLQDGHPQNREDL